MDEIEAFIDPLERRANHANTGKPHTDERAGEE